MADEQKMFARQAEVFSAFLDMTDTEIGRLVQAELKKLTMESGRSM